MTETNDKPTFFTVAPRQGEYIQISLERLFAVIYEAPAVMEQCAAEAANADAEAAFERLGDWFWRLNECIKTPHFERLENDEQCPPDCAICAEVPDAVH